MSAPDFEAAKAAFLQGLEWQRQRRWPDAEAAYRRSLALLPGRASTLINLAAALNAQQRPDEALPLLEQALAVEPQATDAWFQRSEALGALGRLPEALEAVESLLRLQPEAGPAWSRKGALLKELGHGAAAVPALERAIALGADVDINRYVLASLTGRDAPRHPPDAYVSALFDGYAADFDAQLVGKLHYDAPERLVRGLPGDRYACALDLGCGTGLVGRRLRARVQRLVGVDLSAGMLDQARASGAYDALHREGLVPHLQGSAERHDLVVAADVFIYVGDLDAVFAGVRRVLLPDGVFAFTVEQADDAVDWELRASSRYAQSERYLRVLAAAHGFDGVTIEPGPLREEQRVPVAGLYAWLTPRRAR